MGIELDDRDINCLAWFMMSTVSKSDPLYGCSFCRYNDGCTKAINDHEPIHCVMLREKIRKTAGIDAVILLKQEEGCENRTG